MKTFNSLTIICCNSIIQNKIYYHNLVPWKLQDILDELKRKIYPEEFYEYDEDPYYDEYEKKICIPEGCKFKFSKSSNIKYIKTDIYLIFKRESDKKYIKDKVVYNKKLLTSFYNENYLIINKNDYNFYNKNYLLLEDYPVLI